MLDFDWIEWDEPDAAGFNNVRHIEAAGLAPEDVEQVLYSPNAHPATSNTSGRPTVFGWTPDGRWIIVIYELTDEGGVRVIYPVTAYEIAPPG